MSTTLNKLEYLDETKSQIKTALNQFGSGITDSDTFRSYADKIDDIYNNWSTVSGTGENVTLNNTKAAKMKQLQVGGNSEQVQYSGKNLFNNNIGVKLNYSATGTKIETGMRATQTTSGQWKYFTIILPNSQSLTGKTVTLSTVINPSSNNVGRIAVFRISKSTGLQEGDSIAYISQTGNIQFTFPTNLSENYDFGLLFYANTNGTGNINDYVNYTNVQIEQGSATDFEPYVGGTASPNPSYPQEITNVTGDVEVLVQNKNIFDSENEPMYENTPLQNTGIASGSSSVSNVSQYIKVKESTNYVLSLTNDSYSRRICFYTKPLANENIVVDEFISFVEYTGNSKSFTTPVGCNYIRIGYYNGSADIMLEENTTATTYTPHAQQTFTFPLGTQKMFLGDYLADDGIHHVRGQVVLDGSETWNQRTNSAGNKQFYCNTNATNVVMNNQLCNYAKFSSSVFNWGGIGSFGLLDNTHGFYLTVNNELELNTFKTAIATNNIIAEYPLAEEEIEAYTTEQQTAYNQIKQALSYYEQTNISGTSDEAEPIFTVAALMKGGN